MNLSRSKFYERYAIISEILEIAATLCLLLWFLTGPSIFLRNLVLRISPQPWTVIALYSLCLTICVSAVNFPVTVFRGYILPRHMGISKQSVPEWLWDKIKGWVIGAILGTGIMELLYALLRYTPHLWWLYAAVGFLVFTVILSMAAPIIFIPIFFHVTPLKDRILSERLRTLARKARFRVKGIFEFNLGRKTRAVNAALTGLGHTRRILLSDTLLASFTPREIETVLAHELGHHAGSHLWKGILFNGAMTFLGLFLVDQGFSVLLPHFSFTGLHDVANFPLLALSLSAVGIISVPMSNAASRHMERAADLFSLRLTRRPAAFVSAMRKLARMNIANPDPHPVVEFFFYSHPPIRKRIALAQSL